MADLIVIDGGAGQLNVAVKVLNAMSLDIPVISLAKRYEEIYLPGLDQPLRLPRASEVLKLLQRLRNEAHRFAIEHNRKRIRKRALTSILDHVPGIGEHRRQALQQKFGSLDGIKQAGVDELASVPGMNTRAAQAVYDFFHKDV
jgi:excinuclease ABC subunit C